MYNTLSTPAWTTVRTLHDDCPNTRHAPPQLPPNPTHDMLSTLERCKARKLHTPTRKRGQRTHRSIEPLPTPSTLSDAHKKPPQTFWRATSIPLRTATDLVDEKQNVMKSYFLKADLMNDKNIVVKPICLAIVTATRNRH